MGYVFKKGTEFNFWHYQILGWSAFSVWDFFNSFDWWVSPLNIIVPKWIINIAIAFSLSLALRYFYQRVYKKNYRSAIIIVICFISSFICSLIWYYIRFVAFELIDNNSMTHGGISRFVNSVPLRYYTMIIYYSWPHFLWSILYFWIKYFQELLAERERVSKAETLLQRTQLQILRYQINPHFLFNSLNSIKALTFENPEKARLMLTEFSEFLRSTLSYNNKVFVPVKEEADIIEKYLAIEKIRFEGRLNYILNYNRDILDKQILCFITQPLVENAIKHGLTNNRIGITININFTEKDDKLVVEIINNGKLENKKNPDGTGIKNVIERLDNAYPNQYLFSINEEDNFVKVRLLIPIK